ncbi:hypothetical protein HGG76_05765 [Ochrobactrum tritici]|uniref:Uncharacterized protein n=1 Tax=Brucella tritici TaxID=94626 RepID=A0A7X6JA32_9HYPH|nr:MULTISPECIES: hypothetical protein [Brucella]NKW09404.1 hypothetical protein [Brucella tritici]
MAKQKWEPSTYYEVKLSEPIKVGPVWHRPDHGRVVLLGSVAANHEAAIIEATKAEV